MDNEQSESSNSVAKQLSMPVAIIIGAVLISGTLLYTNSDKTSTAPSQPKTGTISYTLAELKKWARTAKLDGKAFDACLDSTKYADKVKNDFDSGVALGVQGTPTFFVNGVMIDPPGAQPFATFQKYIIDASPTSSKTIDPKLVKSITLNPDDRILGDEKAPVTIVEYSDFQCPFCRSFFEGSYAEIKKEYIDTGRVRLVYRHWPLDFHPMAQPSARAVECASEQGKFWQMHDAIFREQVK